MAADKVKLLIERVNLRTILVALVIVVLGVILLYLSNQDFWTGYEAWQVVVRDIGGLLIVTVAITLLWELWAKRAFLDEVLVKVRMADEVKLAGLVRVTDSFHRGIDWDPLFHSVNKLDIFFAYGRTWRSTHTEELREVAARKGARIRIVLPDPDDVQTVSELARRFNSTPEKIKQLIKEAETDFRNLRHISAGNGAQIGIWFLPATPQFSFYRFDHIAIFALYSHSRERVPIPTFVVEMGGTLYDYIRKEFEAMIRPGGLARPVTSEEK